jgi:hypothetical protein
MKLLKIAYHRNGVSGLGFDVAILRDGKNRKMLVVRFSKEADKGAGAVLCAAFDLDLLAKDEIGFGVNSWRGDEYADFLDPLIAEWEEGKFENDPRFSPKVVPQVGNAKAKGKEVAL